MLLRYDKLRRVTSCHVTVTLNHNCSQTQKVDFLLPVYELQTQHWMAGWPVSVRKWESPASTNKQMQLESFLKCYFE